MHLVDSAPKFAPSATNHCCQNSWLLLRSSNHALILLLPRLFPKIRLSLTANAPHNPRCRSEWSLRLLPCITPQSCIAALPFPVFLPLAPSTSPLPHRAPSG